MRAQVNNRSTYSANDFQKTMKTKQIHINVLNQYYTGKGENDLVQGLTTNRGKLNLCFQIKATTAASTSYGESNCDFDKYSPLLEPQGAAHDFSPHETLPANISFSSFILLPYSKSDSAIVVIHTKPKWLIDGF